MSLRCVPTSLTCPDCWALYRVHGRVVQVVDDDGVVLWQRCACGADVPIEPAVQQRLFA